MVLGVGNILPNEGEQHEEPIVAKGMGWKELLGDKGQLRPWSEVFALKATKVNLGNALREYMRLAWGETILFITIFSI